MVSEDLRGSCDDKFMLCTVVGFCVAVLLRRAKAC